MKSKILFVMALCALPCQASVRFFVAPDGNDAWSGALEKPNVTKTDGPLASLQGARDAVRKAKAQEAVEVSFAPGIYFQNAPVDFNAADSGTDNAPVKYRANGVVRITGGKQISDFAPVQNAAILQQLPTTARGKVLQCDLKAQGITDFGNLSRRGMGKAITPAHLELFFNDEPMTLARWPNADEAMPYSRVAALPEGQNGLTFGVGDDLAPRLEKWKNEKEAWVFGYWFHDWADEYIPLTKVDAAAKTLTLQDPKPNYGIKIKQRFYGLNLLSELDQPGEWFLDREDGKLYFWPPSDVKTGSAYVSIAPSLVNIKNASNIWFEGFTIEGPRGTAMTINDSDKIWISSCTLRNIGNRAITISGGKNCEVRGCDVYRTGDGGISLSGGDRKTLTPCNHVADNNHIYDYSRWSRTYRPAIGVGGDGVRVSHNLLHDGQHNAIQLGGNDHIIEFNEIHSVAYDTGDVGAFYMGRDWTARGTVIRHNYFHDIKGPGTYGAMGVYLDDQASGIDISGNVFYEVTRAMFVGGGDDNLISNNIFVKCVPSVHIDARGMGWQKKATDDPEGELRRYLRAMPYQNELWSKRYPTLVNVLDDDPNAPKRNLVQRNISIGGKWDDVEKKGAEWQIFKDNFAVWEDDLVKQLPNNPRATDFDFLQKIPLVPAQFEAIPLAQIGLREEVGLSKNDRRASWPVTTTPRPTVKDQAAAVQSPTLKRGALPVFKVTKAQAVPTVDGVINANEWNGANANKALLMEQDLNGAKATPTSLAWLQYDVAGLWIAIDNATDPNATLRKGDTWGADDAVEVALLLENVKQSEKRVATVYRGFPSGTWLVTDENGLSPAMQAKAKTGVRYATRANEQGRWSAEWFIPWQSLGFAGAPPKGTRFAFNLTARKPASDLWLMWRGTQGNSYLVENAGFLEIE